MKRAFAEVVLGSAAVLSVLGCGAQEPTGSAPRSSPQASSPTTTGTAPIPTVSPSPSPTPSTTPGTMPTGPFTLTSFGFDEGGPIPVDNTCDGAGSSPPLAWTDAPAGTGSYALIVDDTDANGFVHWVVFNVSPELGGLGPVIPPDAGPELPQGRNSFGKVGYGGPCPPSGTHHYRFRLMALAARLSLSGTPTAAQVGAAAAGKILGEAVLTGTYRRH